ncbi:carboxymuconolactone decarboxylase family protein [Geodermatophilus nigrescens]|uniref:Alkylhydroperoxidase AhpD family core domain-containing protein n=1 Tax=Geodermatophilus nigrescens TaxID=1070870 RepID=A0A1M5EV60_9ACTN|nr:carboxymuconolactone decarboxylase family protein [Geodermatophilus nigrescens]SHF83097.1 alkylhydroperoxidase AhpD family core domain-containing protein [Geodermatophilus nigrescens]
MTARLPEASGEGPTGDLLRARRGGTLTVLDRLLLHSPPVAEGWNALLGALRGGSTLPADLRELVVLRVAVLTGAEFEWTAHEPIGRRAGLTDRHLRRLRAAEPTADPAAEPADGPVWTPAQAAVLAFTDASARAVDVPDAVFAAVREHLDDRQVVELTVLVGGYCMVSRFLVAMRVPPSDGEVAG